MGEQQKEVIISYESVFDMLRREKNRNELQQLPPNFLADVADYLQAKKTLLHKGFDNAPVEEKQKLMLHIQNMKKLLRELYDKRETKLLLLAQNKARTGDVLVDESVMLPDEKVLLESLSAGLSTIRKKILHSMAQNASDHQLFEATYGVNAGQEPAAEVPTTPTSSVSQPLLNVANLLTVRFLQEVPKFVGRDLQVYGPYAQEDIATLPQELASILLSKGRAEELKSKLG